MRPIVLGMILLSVSLSSGAQLLLKMGMSSASMKAALAKGPSLQWAFALICSPFVMTGLTAYFVSAVVWLFVLSKLELSAAYPFVGMGFIFTLLVGWLVLGEHLSVLRVMGTLMVAGGAILVARTV